MVLVRSGSHRGYYREYKPSKDNRNARKPRYETEDDSVELPRRKKQGKDANTTIIREIIEPIYDPRKVGMADNRGFVSMFRIKRMFILNLG